MKTCSNCKAQIEDTSRFCRYCGAKCEDYNGTEEPVYSPVENPAEAPAKISSTLNINDEVLRYLLVKTDVRRAKLAARREASEKADKEEAKTESKEEE